MHPTLAATAATTTMQPPMARRHFLSPASLARTHAAVCVSGFPLSRSHSTCMPIFWYRYNVYPIFLYIGDAHTGEAERWLGALRLAVAVTSARVYSSNLLLPPLVLRCFARGRERETERDSHAQGLPTCPHRDRSRSAGGVKCEERKRGIVWMMGIIGWVGSAASSRWCKGDRPLFWGRSWGYYRGQWSLCFTWNERDYTGSFESPWEIRGPSFIRVWFCMENAVWWTFLWLSKIISDRFFLFL